MARAREHELDVLLDAARGVVLEGGARGASISAIARASGASTGSLYHAYGSRDGIVAALWARAARRSEEVWLAAIADDPLAEAAAKVRALVAFVREHPADARLLFTVRPQDLTDAPLDLEELNAPMVTSVRRLAGKIGGPRAVERVRLALIDMPYGALRVHPPSAALADDLVHAALAVLAPRP